MQHLNEGAASFLFSVRSLLHLATIVLKGLQLIRSDMEESGPFLRALIIDENVGLVKKAGKASFNTELLGRRPGMVRPWRVRRAFRQPARRRPASYRQHDAAAH